MKTRLVLSVDSDVAHMLRRWARTWDRSVSQVVEDIARTHRDELDRREGNRDGDLDNMPDTDDGNHDWEGER